MNNSWSIACRSICFHFGCLRISLWIKHFTFVLLFLLFLLLLLLLLFIIHCFYYVTFVISVRTGQPEYFDAFVCYAAEDISFVKQLINILEEQNGLKLCIRHRDITLGSASNPAISFLISRRLVFSIITEIDINI